MKKKSVTIRSLETTTFYNFTTKIFDTELWQNQNPINYTQ